MEDGFSIIVSQKHLLLVAIAKKKKQQCGGSHGVVHTMQEKLLLSVDDIFDSIRCINLQRRPDRWQAFLLQQQPIPTTVQRYNAVDGNTISVLHKEEVQIEWNATTNAKYDPHIQAPMIKYCTMGEVGCTLSHVRLWKELSIASGSNNNSMLILEDDAIFHPSFATSFDQMWKLVPEDWDFVYLGFCNVGPTTMVRQETYEDNMTISIVRPSYGFYTHAYAIRDKAARHLLSKLPVVGPIDTWLADNAWFGLNVYLGVMGKSTCIIGQRRTDLKNDIVHSAHLRNR